VKPTPGAVLRYTTFCGSLPHDGNADNAIIATKTHTDVFIRVLSSAYLRSTHKVQGRLYRL
jgi:hypothetical protein